MADEAQYSSDTTMPNKRNYDDQTMTLSSGPRGPTGFSSGPPIPAPDSAAAPPSYNNVPPPVDDFRAAKRRAEQIAARLLNSAPADDKRPRVDNGSGAFDSTDKGFSSPPSDVKPSPVPSAIPVSNGGFQDGIGTSKKIEIPNIRVGVIIGKGGETIKYLQLQSGAKIQVTRDMEADLGSPTRMVELMGTPEQITKAEQLINDVLAEAETGGSGIIARRLTGQAGSESFVMKIPNNKVGLVIGKGGETIKNMQARTGARIQVIPLHLPPGDTLTGRTVQIDGSSEQIESAKQLVNEVIIENRLRNPAMAGGYSQQGYQAPPHTNWGTLGAPPMQQPGYGYVQPGAYPGPSPQYNMSQPSYAVYPSQSTSGGYSANWDQSSVPPSQQTSQGSGYDYYSQQPTSQQPPAPGGSAAPAGNFGYNYNQPAASGYNQQGQGHSQDGYGGYHVPPSGYGQPSSYDQQQGYNSASSYGNVTNSTQEGHTPSYGTGDSTQAPPPAQGYGTSQQPSPNPASYPPQGAAQPGYVVPPSQGGYGNQAPVQSAYPIYGPPQGQKPNPPAYVQTQQSPTAAGGYGQPAPVQPGYPHSQPPSTGYSQPDSDSQRAPPSSYGGPAQQGYGGYGAPPVSQPGYGQGPPSYNSYGGGYPQYSADGNAAAPASQPVQQSAVSKSPQS